MRQTLENGLTVVLQENRASRVAALQLWVKVGSADETEPEAGLAHVHEHMLFKGTNRRGPGEIARTVEHAGGEINAWTSFDQTVYHLVVPAAAFEDGVDILADVVTESRFDPEELSRELEVVLEEILRSEDQPSRRASKLLFGLAYAKHPYRRPVIGWERTVRSFTRDGILDFYRRHYVAKNMTLVCVGAFDEVKALDVARKAFANVRTAEPQRPPRDAEPAPTGLRVRIETGTVKEAYLSLGWHGPGVSGKDVAALDLLTAILGQGDSSRLVLDVKREQQLVNEVYASAYTPQDPGLVIVGATLPHEKVHAAVEELLRQTYRLRREEVLPDELARAKRMTESDTLWQRETVQGQARKLGFFETVAGHVDEEERYLAAIAAATPADLRAAAERWFKTDALNIVVLGGEEELRAAGVTDEALTAIAQMAETSLPAQVVPQKAPPYTRLAMGSFVPRRRPAADLVVETLPSGLKLVVKEDTSVPLVSMRAAWVGGLRGETPETNGAHGFLSRMLLRGTERRSATAIAREIDDLAAGLSGSAGRNSFGARGEFLSADLDRGFDLFADVLQRPALDPKELERERALILEEIRSRDDSPGSAAFSLFNAALYDTHPYRMELGGSDASVRALDDDALRGLLASRYRTDGLVLSVVGDVSVARVRDLVARHFPGDQTPRGASPNPALDGALTGPREVRKRLVKKQAHVVVGFRGLTLDDPERPALDVLNAVLSGQGGRLFLELRDKKSLAYSVTSMAGEGIDPGYFAAYMGTSPEKVPEALRGIREQLDRVVQEPIPVDELERAKRHLAGTHEIGLQRLSGRSAAMALDEAYGLGAAFHRGFPERVHAVTPERVLSLARRIIDFERCVTALVSPDA